MKTNGGGGGYRRGKKKRVNLISNFSCTYYFDGLGVKLFITLTYRQVL